MTRTRPCLTFAFLLLSGALSLAATSPGAEAFLSSGAMAGLFLRSDDGAATLGLEPPTNTQPAVVAGSGDQPMVGPLPGVCVATPAGPGPMCSQVVFGTVTAPGPFQILGPAGLELWLSTQAPALPLVGLSASLLDLKPAGKVTTIVTFDYGTGDGSSVEGVAPRDPGATPMGADSSGLFLSPTPRRIDLDASLATPFDVATGDRLFVSLDTVAAPLTVEDKADVLVNYGSSMPSGVLFEIHGAQVWREMLSPNVLGVFPAEKTNLTFERPAAANDSARAFSPPTLPAGGAAQPSVKDAAVLAWGPLVLDEDVRVPADALAELFVKTTAAASPTFAFDVRLDVGNHSYLGSTALVVDPSSALTRVVVALPVHNATWRAGSPVNLSVSVFGANASSLGVLVGGIEHPSGVLIPVDGGGTIAPPLPPLPVDNATAARNETEASTEVPSTEPSSPAATPSGTLDAGPAAILTTQEVGRHGAPGLGHVGLFTALIVGFVVARSRKGS